MAQDKRLLVISSHAMDFLWRAGGTIARYAQLGWQIRIIDLTFGERGESDSLWEQNPGITEEGVKTIRKKEVEAVQNVLNVTVEFKDWGDHLLNITQERIEELAYTIKQFRPSIILTQYEKDVLNFDHPATAKAVFSAVRLARVAGVFPELPRITLPEIFMYEPSQPELFGFQADTYIDITDQMDKKVEAMQAVGAQEYLIESYRVRATYRGLLAKMLSGKKSLKYAEAFVRFSPSVSTEF